MTGKEAYDKALKLLGYSNEDGAVWNDALLGRASVIINNIYAELYYSFKSDGWKEITVRDEIPLPEKLVNDCFVYGVATQIAQGEGDGDSQQLYASLYNQKRRQAHVGTIQDVFSGGDEL